MNSVIRAEFAGEVLGNKARFFNVVAADDGRILNQTAGIFAKVYTEGGRKFRIRAELRFDDQCHNGHESFSITGDIDAYDDGRWLEYSAGCIHEDIARHYPALAPLIKWHLTSTDGPMHYLANVIYHAGDRDHNGRRKGEASRYEYGVRFGNSPVTHRVEKSFYTFLQDRISTGEFRIAEFAHDTDPKTYGTHYSVQGYGSRWHECPFRDEPAAVEFILALNTCPVEFVKTATEFSEGKTREFDHARSGAVWPEATDAELSQEPAELKAALEARLPALLAEFKTAMLAVGFLWPDRKPVTL